MRMTFEAMRDFLATIRLTQTPGLWIADRVVCGWRISLHGYPEAAREWDDTDFQRPHSELKDEIEDWMRKVTAYIDRRVEVRQ